MIIIETRNYKEMSKCAAEIIINEIIKKPKIVLGFATGETQVELYKELIKSYRKRKIDFSNMISFNLDEYYPIKNNNKNSYYFYMQKNLFKHINIRKSNINFLNGETENWMKECNNYEDKIKKNPIDIQILGLGVNGHIAFNEPGVSFNSRTRVIDLSPETRRRNSKFFKSIDDVPKKALSMGIATINHSKKIIVLASGVDKARVVKCLVEGKINKKCPASALKKHKNLILIIDKKAASLL